MDEYEFYRKTLKDAAKYADKRRRERDVAVDDRGRAEARIHLNQLRLQSFQLEEPFGLSYVLRHGRAAPACVGDPDSRRRFRTLGSDRKSTRLNSSHTVI